MKGKLAAFLVALSVILALLAAFFGLRLHRERAALAEAQQRLSEAEALSCANAAERDALRLRLDDAEAQAAAAREALAEMAKAAPAEETAEAQPDPDSGDGSLTERSLATVHLKAFRYLLYEPAPAAAEPLPLLLFLHGSGGCGDDIADVFSDDTLPTMLQRGWLSPDALVVIPQCPGDSWDPYCEDLMELLESVAAQYDADPDRISVTGFSLGGIGCFSMLCRYPDYFSAAMPISAICEEPAACAAVTSTPVRILHGENDRSMDSSYVILANEIINAAGGHSTLTFLPGEGHFIQQHYLDDGGEPIAWLIAQRRGT